MRKTFILQVILILITTSSFNVAPTHRGKIIRNCIGTYLRMNHANYLVCNDSILSVYETGKMVSVRYEHTKCQEPVGEVCTLYFQSKGSIEITRVN